MAIQSSGPVYLTDLQTEFGGSSSPIYLGTYYNGGGRVPSNNTNVPAAGAINLGHFYNAVNRVALSVVFSTDTTQTTINPTAIPGYIAGISDIVITVNSGIYVYSTDTATPALTINGGLTAGDTIALVNNGYIMGMGGAGGTNATGSNGGPAMSLGTNINITNNSYIGGGGGGGGGGRGGISSRGSYRGNSGGGGGAGGGSGAAFTDTSGFNTAGGSGGAPGAKGADGPASGNGAGINAWAGGGGGRIMPGTTQANAGLGGEAGGTGGGYVNGSGSWGGVGGIAGNVGGNGGGGTLTWGGGGGGYGAAGGSAYTLGIGSGSGASGGGSGGSAIVLNGSTITYLTTGTIYGAVS